MGRVADMVDRWMALKDYSMPVFETDQFFKVTSVIKQYAMDKKNELNLLRMIARVKEGEHYRLYDGIDTVFIKQFKDFYLSMCVLNANTAQIDLQGGTFKRSEFQTKTSMTYDEYYNEFRKIEHEINEIVRSNGPCVFVKPDCAETEAVDNR